MRITKISVKKLFGVFDHEIPLNQESRITIIHGPNGVGKTVLMTMIDGLLSSKYEIFSGVPFELFTVELSSGERICVKGSVSEFDRPEHTVEVDDGEDSVTAEAPVIHYFKFEESGTERFVPKITEQGRQKIQEHAESIFELRSIGNDRWESLLSGAVMTIDDVIKAYDLQDELYDEPDWLKNIKRKVKTGFIQAQRLQEPGLPGMYGFPTFSISRRRRTSSTPRATVERYAKELAKKIGDALAEYGQESQILDRSFPKRFLESDSSARFGENELRAKLENLEDKRSTLMDLGLLDTDKDAPDIPSNVHENANVLSIYVQDMDMKLGVFDEISEQLSLLKEIICSRFMFKDLSIDRRAGFVIIARDGSRIPIDSLSSGEQHQLVILYQLLFNVEYNSLILIDEPELSLHVDWQEQFLNDLQRIIKFREFDLLIATHSPTLVDDKSEWMVGLQYPEGAC